MITVPGIAGIDVIGGYEKQYLVQPDPARLTGLRLSFSDLARALEQNNVNKGAGYVEKNGEGFAVLSTGRLTTPEQIANVVITTRGGIAIRIKDVATVGIGREMAKSMSRTSPDLFTSTFSGLTSRWTQPLSCM